MYVITLTLTYYPSILGMGTVMYTPTTVCTLCDGGITATAVQIIQPYRTRPLSKICTTSNFCSSTEIQNTLKHCTVNQLLFIMHQFSPISSVLRVKKASVTIMADFCPEFNPPFRWRCKHQTKIAMHINNLVSSEFPNRSNRSARSFTSTLNCT